MKVNFISKMTTMPLADSLTTTRGPAKGYIEGLEHRLHDAESLLLQVLPFISQTQLRAATASLSIDRISETEDPSADKRASPPPLNKKTGIDYWDSFPLDTVDNIRRWQNDCEVQTANSHEPKHDSQRSSPLVDSRPPSVDVSKANRRAPNTGHRYSTSLEATAALQSFRLRQNPPSMSGLPTAQLGSRAASQDPIAAISSSQSTWIDPSTFIVPQKQNTTAPTLDMSQFMDNWSQQTAMDIDGVGGPGNAQSGVNTQDSQLNLFW